MARPIGVAKIPSIRQVVQQKIGVLLGVARGATGVVLVVSVAVVSPLAAQEAIDSIEDAGSAVGAAEDSRNRALIGYVSISRIIDDSPQSEAAMRELEREFAPRDAQLIAEREALANIRERLESSPDALSVQERADLEREFTTRSRELRRAQESFTEDLNLRRNEELARLQRRINEAIVRLARQRGIDLVVTERNVLFASDRIDLTDEVTRVMQD